ncbi:MAG: hypothetical protein J0I20_11965 [Chloroflexi bacterium]|nr:hypothetical protein [Chloroflexota bacterium]OJV92445.1 MAG: hypothetical protein BGO39_31480 [Chloroflexi bacterium 54-19]
MTKELSLVPFSEFSNNLDSFFEQVVRENKEIVIENEQGEQVLLKPAPASKRKHRTRTEADHQAFLASAGGWKDVDTDKLLDDIYESRRTSSRPPVDL